jgi:predicted GNAT family acetyltransferase
LTVAEKLDSAEIQHLEGSDGGAFVVERAGRRLAELVYTTRRHDRISIDHTEVKDDLRGTGAGGKLVEAAVLWARAAGKKIIPICPFAKSVFERMPGYKDVLA